MWKIKVGLILSTLLTYSSMVLGASLQVSPIALNFKVNEKAQEIWLTNTSDKTIRAQTRVLDWTQEKGQDKTQATKALVASPAVTEIKAGERQLIRIIKVIPLPQDKEQTFRLMIDELPEKNKGTEQVGLQLLLQYSVPVFLQSNQDIPVKAGITSLQNISFSYQNNQIMVNNQANSHIRISQLTYINPNGEKIEIVKGLLGYALAHQSIALPIQKIKTMQPNGKFEARINMDSSAQKIPID